MCHGLKSGENYVFRVKAVNAAGYSPSSPDSEAVLVKAAVCKPLRISSTIICFTSNPSVSLCDGAPTVRVQLPFISIHPPSLIRDTT